jgi:hypothetical protein
MVNLPQFSAKNNGCKTNEYLALKADIDYLQINDSGE